jgi:hypothetical protein
MSTPRIGRPSKSARALASRRRAHPRWSQDAPVALVEAVDAEARRNDRSRNAEVRVLLADALDARNQQRNEAEKEIDIDAKKDT